MVPEKFILTGRIRQRRAQQMSMIQLSCLSQHGIISRCCCNLILDSLLTMISYFATSCTCVVELLNHELPGIENR
jgi:hypothetical protein